MLGYKTTQRTMQPARSWCLWAWISILSTLSKIIEAWTTWSTTWMPTTETSISSSTLLLATISKKLTRTTKIEFGQPKPTISSLLVTILILGGLGTSHLDPTLSLMWDKHLPFSMQLLNWDQWAWLINMKQMKQKRCTWMLLMLCYKNLVFISIMMPLLEPLSSMWLTTTSWERQELSKRMLIHIQKLLEI